MKKLLLLALSAAFVLNSSCSSDDDGGAAPEGEINGSLSVEEGKKQLEDNSIALLDKVEAFSNNDALKEIIELAEFLTASNVEDTTNEDPFENTVLKTLENFKDTKNDVVTLNAKQAITIVNETSLIEDFNDLKGIYTWDDSAESFEQTGDSDDVIYNIAYNNGKNATFSFTDFTTTVIGADDEELPTLVKANLSIDNREVFSQEYTASFQGDQLIPASISNTTTIADFVFQTTYTNNNNATINQSFDFKIGNETIMGYNYTANGTFNNEDDTIENIVNDFNANFNFLNARLNVTGKTDGFNSESELTVDEQVALLNSNTSATLSINQKLIANSEFYKDQDTYTTFPFNEDTQEFEELEVSEDIINARFLFEDGTSNDFDTYVEGSFTELENKFETVFEAYESLFEDVNP